jgi:hypothetical protein
MSMTKYDNKMKNRGFLLAQGSDQTRKKGDIVGNEAK